MGRELGLDANLERAQEIIYEAVQTGTPLSEEAREFALALGLAPAALAALATPPGDEDVAATEPTLTS